MKTRKHESQQKTSAAKPVLSGFLMGSVIGAATALLFAPRSGEETRMGIRDKAIDLRDQATETVKDTVSQARSKASDVKDDVLDKVGELKERGKQIVTQKLDRVSEAAATEKQKVQEY